MADLTQLLEAAERGEPRASEQLLPLVYHELRRLAAAKLAHEPAGQTLQATALVHEAYLRLLGDGDPPSWDGRGHFFAAAAEAMRRILIETARRKRSHKGGGGQTRISLEGLDQAAQKPSVDLLALDQALETLSTLHPEQAALVKLRYFAGLSNDEAARALGVSLATIKRRWALAKAWLFRELEGGSHESP
jgi:RNA polymerase sigma factor (TIGR02999 family)